MSNVFKSRWGFHPCDYATFLKLKEINKWWWKFLHERAAWERWNNKWPKNRHGSEPEFSPYFNKDNCSWVEDYQNARQPKEEEKVERLNHTIDEINQMYFRCRDWEHRYKMTAA